MSSGRSFVRASLATLTLSLTGVLAPAPMALASPDAALSAQAGRVAAWSDTVWSSAERGEAESALELLDRLPDGLGELGLDDLSASIERYKRNIAAREEMRRERIAEIEAELATYPAEIEVSDALDTAVEWHTLALDKAGVLNDPMIVRIVEDARRAAAEAEAAGEWLDAHFLVNRLNVLFEEGRFRDDLDRLNQRLVMLNLYVPERLHEMRSAQRVADGEDALPPFNDIGGSWEDKLDGINERMVIQAVMLATGGHVYEATTKDMLLGGIDALRTMVTTTDLRGAFPQLNNAASRDSFLTALAEQRAELVRTPVNDVELGTVVRIVRDLRQANLRTLKLDDRALLHEFGNGFTSRLDDYSAMIWPDEVREFAQQTRGDFHGIGVQISLNDALELSVVAPISGTPAANAGLRPGDVIVRIDGEDTTGIALSQAVDRITGDKGTPVTLTIRREGAEELLTFTMNRDSIPLHATKGWKRDGADETDWDYMVDPDNRIGYVRVTRFNENTTSELRSALSELKIEDVEGFILDLRSNPGGLLTEAVGVTNLFLESGTIVSQEDRYGNEENVETARRWRSVLGETPMVVLINGGSASASEIVAGALRDNGRAILVGERSFGKGSVQNVIPIRGTNSYFKLTTQLYMLPSGESIHRDPSQPGKSWGVEPNVHVEMLPKQISDWLEQRQDADVVQLDDMGRLAGEPTDPTPLITDGIDIQLETAVLLLQNKIAVSERLAELDRGNTRGLN
jgi:carboxyl-terminal processing protease